MEPVTISKRVGKDAPNEEGDVRKIQHLLNQARIGPNLQVNGTCDANTISAIGNFQRLWSLPDYRIDPGGGTLRRLNGLLKPIELKKISLIRVSKGGYAVTYRGLVPPKGYTVMLYPEGRGNQSYSRLPQDAVDVTKPGLENKDGTVALGFFTTLPQMLKLIESGDAWGSLMSCRLYLTAADRTVVSVSNEMFLQCPLKPYPGPIRLDMATASPPMYYAGKTTGRYFWPDAIGGKYYFAYAGVFETEEKKRGFDCTTYVGTVLGLNPLKGQMSGTGKDIADLVGAEAVSYEYGPGKTTNMENVNKDRLKGFFAANATGAYVLWTSGHVMLVVDGEVHEFNIPDGPPGYYRRKVNDRPWQSGNVFNVRKVPAGRI